MVRPQIYALLIAGFFVLLSGCEEKLEDGYEPTKLGATLEQRQHYYSAPYATDTSKDHDAGSPAPSPQMGH